MMSTKIRLYAAYTSPIMNLKCPPKFCTTFFHISYVVQPSQEKMKTMLMQNLEGGQGWVWQIRCIMEDVQVAYRPYIKE